MMTIYNPLTPHPRLTGIFFFRKLMYNKKMKIILSAINTKFTHKALSLSCLKSYWDLFHNDIPLIIKEFDLNILNETIINDLLLIQPDILAFSTYIWSIERIITVAGAIKAAFPKCIIILGGPEVSYNSTDIINRHKNIDYIIRGEGEITFKELLESLIDNKSFESIPGITYRKGGKAMKNKERQLIKDLDILPSPFITGNYQGSSNFTYYEASRGCPSKCAYCLSSVQGLVRNHSIERIEKDLDWFFQSDFDQIRFADRTFNYDVPRALHIINYIKQNNKKCKNFHFEIQADFLSDEIIELLSDAPKGMFHLEIGVQSTNNKALEMVNRTFDLEEMKSKINKLRSKTNCYLHLDVLGGLPYDTYSDFCKSLDDVASLKPEDIQISLVKVLHGTPYEYMANKTNDFYYMTEPPYTILRTKWLKPDEAVMISQISKLFEGIGNTNRFNNSINHLVTNYFNGSYSKFYENLVLFWRDKKYLFYNFSPENTVKHLKEYSKQIISNDFDYNFIESLLEHELRMTLKTPNTDSWNIPIDYSSDKKPKFKLKQDLRGYWYKIDPTNNYSSKSIQNYPVIYSFSRLVNDKPFVDFLNIPLSKSFTLMSIQKKIPLDKIEDIWKSLYLHEPLPDFNKIIAELLESNYILFTAHNN